MWIVSVPDHCLSFYFVDIDHDVIPFTSFATVQVRFSNLIPMHFFHKSLHTP